MKTTLYSIILILALLSGIGCDDSLTGSDTGNISAENQTHNTAEVTIDGARVGALTPGKKEVYEGYSPGKYWVVIQGCSGAYVTVQAGQTRGLVCYAK
jgi:hypothetical protein